MGTEEAEVESLIEQILKEGVKAANMTLSSNFSVAGWYNASLSMYSHPFASMFPRNFAMVLAVCGIIANSVSLAAMLHISGSFSCNQKLIFNLLLSNFFISVTLLCVTWSEALFPSLPPGLSNASDLCEYVITKAFVMTGHSIAILNLVALAFDHFMAINKPLEYIQVFTSKRVSLALIVMWVLAGLFGFSDILLPMPYYSYCEGKEIRNICESSYCTRYEIEYLLFCLVFLCFVAMAYFYFRVFWKIYKYQRMTGRHQRQMKRNVKGLITTLVILGTFLVCWLPHAVFETYFVVLLLLDNSTAIYHFNTFLDVNYYLYWLWLVNSICDPVIYAVRMREVKQGYHRMLRCQVLARRLGGVVGTRTDSSSLCRRSMTPSTVCDPAETTMNVTYSTCNSSTV